MPQQNLGDQMNSAAAAGAAPATPVTVRKLSAVPPTPTQAKKDIFKRQAVAAIAALNVSIDPSLTIEAAKEEASKAWDEACTDPDDPKAAINALWSSVAGPEIKDRVVADEPSGGKTSASLASLLSKAKRKTTEDKDDDDDDDYEAGAPRSKSIKISEVSRELAENMQTQMATAQAQSLISGKSPAIQKWCTSLTSLAPEIQEACNVAFALEGEAKDVEDGKAEALPSCASEAIFCMATLMRRVQKGFQLQFVIIYLLAFAGPESGAKLCDKYFESRQLSLLGMNLDEDTVKEINKLKKAVRDESKDSGGASKSKGGQPQSSASRRANFQARFGNRNRNSGGGNRNGGSNRDRDNRDAPKRDDKPRNN